MMSPAVAAGRCLLTLVLGLLLGLLYGFLRPFRQRFRTLGDLCFLLLSMAALVYQSFGICRGDLRLGYLPILIAGGILWEQTAGRLLRKPFSLFWGLFFRIFSIPVVFFKKFFRKTLLFLKKLFASGKKSGTIKWNSRPVNGRKLGGRGHGKPKQPAEKDPSGISPQQQTDQVSGSLCYRVVYGHSADPSG